MDVESSRQDSSESSDSVVFTLGGSPDLSLELEIRDSSSSSENLDVAGNSDFSLETRPPTPKGDGPYSWPTPNGDIPDSWDGTVDTANTQKDPPCRRYFVGHSLEMARERAISRWPTPRHIHYVTQARRVASFYSHVKDWDAKAKPSPDSMASAGFFYDGEYNSFNIITHTYIYFKLSKLAPLSSVLHHH